MAGEWYAWSNTATTSNASWMSWIVTSNALRDDTSGSTWTTWIHNNMPEGQDLQVLRQEASHWSNQEELDRTVARVAEFEAERERERARQLRANELLIAALDKQQREDLAHRGAFRLDVLSRDGTKRRYEITRGRTGNVYQLDEAGNRILKFCAHPRIACPNEDTMLAQKLILEADEEGFLAIANRSAGPYAYA